MQLEYKTKRLFNGGKIRLERQFNNLNRRETEPVNAWVVDAKNILPGLKYLYITTQHMIRIEYLIAKI